jgi:hypothetical protein
VTRDQIDVLLFVAGAASIVGGIAALFWVDRRGLLIVLYMCTLASSFAIYLFPPGIDGRDGFHVRLGIAVGAALAIAAVGSSRIRDAWEIAGRVLACLAAAASPPFILFATIVAVCWGESDCFG